MKQQLQALCTQYGMQLETDVKLSQRTTFRIGGTADYWVNISSVQGLQALLAYCKAQNIPCFVMGRGSNILASDEGFRGVILHLGNAFAEITVSGTIVTCQAGAQLGAAARAAADHSLTGMEGLSGIPGTIGGAVYMNAGAYGTEMKDVVIKCEYLAADGTVKTMQAADLDFSYRHSVFCCNGGIVLTVIMELQKGDPETIRERMEELQTQRKTKQPLEYPSAGSTFKRPQGSYASMLIDQCGLKGASVGDAQVSEKHAGFVVNKGCATCADVLALCRKVREKVESETGYILELEPILLESR